MAPAMEHEGEVFHACFTNDERWVLTVGTDATIQAWDWQTANRVALPRVIPNGQHIHVLQNGTQAIVTGRTRILYSLDLSDLFESGLHKLDARGLRLWGELLSGRRVHESGSVNLTSSEWLDRWREMRKYYAGHLPSRQFLRASQSSTASSLVKADGAGGDPIVKTQATSPSPCILPNGWLIHEPVNLGPTVNSSSDDAAPALSADGLTLLFRSARPGGYGAGDLWMSTRTAISELFDKPVNLGETVNSGFLEGGPALSADGLTLMFHSDRPSGQGDFDLWMCTRASLADPFGRPVNLGPKVNSKGKELQPGLSADNLTLLFALEVLDHWDLWMCTRESLTDSFGEPSRPRPHGQRRSSQHAAGSFRRRVDASILLPQSSGWTGPLGLVDVYKGILSRPVRQSRQPRTGRQQ